MTIKMNENPGVVETVIDMLNNIEVDGETMNFIIEYTNMKDQMLRQLVLQADSDLMLELLMERNSLA